MLRRYGTTALLALIPDYDSESGQSTALLSPAILKTIGMVAVAALAANAAELPHKLPAYASRPCMPLSGGAWGAGVRGRSHRAPAASRP